MAQWVKAFAAKLDTHPSSTLGPMDGRRETNFLVSSTCILWHKCLCMHTYVHTCIHTNVIKNKEC